MFSFLLWLLFSFDSPPRMEEAVLQSALDEGYDEEQVIDEEAMDLQNNNNESDGMQMNTLCID